MLWACDDASCGNDLMMPHAESDAAAAVNAACLEVAARNMTCFEADGTVDVLCPPLGKLLLAASAGSAGRGDGRGGCLVACRECQRCRQV